AVRRLGQGPQPHHARPHRRAADALLPEGAPAGGAQCPVLQRKPDPGRGGLLRLLLARGLLADLPDAFRAFTPGVPAEVHGRGAAPLPARARAAAAGVQEPLNGRRRTGRAKRLLIEEEFDTEGTETHPAGGAAGIVRMR